MPAFRRRKTIERFDQSMSPKSVPSGFDPMGGNRFSEKIMLQRIS
jgi:hypothetical protein